MITVSIISHGHVDLVEKLLDDITRCPEVSSVILTYNVPEREAKIPKELINRINVKRNVQPKGFGANHNAAFTLCSSPFFCLINPDVRLLNNPFPELLNCLEQQGAALGAPAVLNPHGILEDSVRHFPTLFGLLGRILRFSDGRYQFEQGAEPFAPDWVAGMFMLLRRADYASVDGFDEGFFLYCEDIDLCARLWKLGRKILVCPTVSVIHDARRASHRNLCHLRWHIRSLLRYFAKHLI